MGPIGTAAVLGAAGLAAGPWVRGAVVRRAVPPGESARRTCPAGHALPLLLPPTGRCPGCGTRVGPAPWLPEAVTAAVLAVVGARVGAVPLVAALTWAALLGVVLGFVDAAVQRLPDALTLPAFTGTAVLLGAAAWAAGRPAVLLRCLLAALVLGALYGAMALLAPMGPGDAKLAPTVGAVLGWFGWPAVLAGVFAGFLLAGLYGAVLLALRRAGARDALPFGPFMLAGALAAVVLGG